MQVRDLLSNPETLWFYYVIKLVLQCI